MRLSAEPCWLFTNGPVPSFVLLSPDHWITGEFSMTGTLGFGRTVHSVWLSPSPWAFSAATT